MTRKSLLAPVAALVAGLLLGIGGGTVAQWHAAEATPVGVITSGNLDIHSEDEHWTWRNTAPDDERDLATITDPNPDVWGIEVPYPGDGPLNAAAHAAVPGDRLIGSWHFTLSHDGDNFRGDLTITAGPFAAEWDDEPIPLPAGVTVGWRLGDSGAWLPFDSSTTVRFNGPDELTEEQVLQVLIDYAADAVIDQSPRALTDFWARPSAAFTIGFEQVRS